MNAGDIMSKTLVAVRSGRAVTAGRCGLMIEHRISGLPVLDELGGPGRHPDRGRPAAACRDRH